MKATKLIRRGRVYFRFDDEEVGAFRSLLATNEARNILGVAILFGIFFLVIYAAMWAL